MAVFVSPSQGFCKSCVWKVTSADGHVLYLGGSVHALRPTDYPLPAEYNRAFDASSRVVFEQDPKTGAAAFRQLVKAGQYPKGDSLKKHVDPRTYEYLRRFFALMKIPETTFSSMRPWLLDILLSAPPAEYYDLGVENFLVKRAQSNSKPMSGLESPSEHNQPFTGLTDRESEALLLILFINAARVNPEGNGNSMVDAWRKGNVDFLAQTVRDEFRDFPSMAERIIGQRNRNWIPKIESYIRSNQTYFVVVGAGHMGGSNGVLALLRARGLKVEQL